MVDLIHWLRAEKKFKFDMKYFLLSVLMFNISQNIAHEEHTWGEVIGGNPFIQRLYGFQNKTFTFPFSMVF